MGDDDEDAGWVEWAEPPPERARTLEEKIVDAVLGIHYAYRRNRWSPARGRRVTIEVVRRLLAGSRGTVEP